MLAPFALLVLGSGDPSRTDPVNPILWESDGSTAHLPSTLHGLDLRADPSGLDVALMEGLGTRRVRVRTVSFGRVGSEAPVAPGELNLAEDRVEIARPGFVEWFEDHSGGVEQGWTVFAMPAVARDTDLWIGVEFTGLWPQIADDGRSAKLVDERAQPRLAYHSLRAWDAVGRELEARMTTHGPHFGVEVDDTGAAYPITIDPILGLPSGSYEPNQANASLSRAAAVGAVKGFGEKYLLAMAPSFDDGANVDAGRVWLLSAGNLAQLWQSSGPSQAGAHFGASATALGDIDGDGYDDFAVSAPDYSNPEVGEGAVFVYRGAALDPVLHWTIEGNVAGAHLRVGANGYLGDVNGDGLRDLGVLAGQGAAAIEELRVYAGSGSPTPTLLWTLTENDLVPNVVPSAASDFTLSGGFDVDADGIDDIALGASAQFGQVGRAFLFRGFVTAVPTLPPTPVWIGTPPGSPAASRFGGSIAFLGDVDGNGYADLAVGAARHPGDNTGAVFVYRADPIALPGSLLPSSPSQTFVGPSPGSSFGQQVSTAGDFGGDGFADLLVTSTVPGAEVSIHRGSLSGLEAVPSWTQGSLQVGSTFGAGAGTAGDMNNDGLGDVWVTAPNFANGQANEGIVYLFPGRAGPEIVATPGVGTASFTSTAATGFGSAFALGDVNGDGVQDLIVGSPSWSNGQANEGRVAVYLSDEATGFSPTPAWTYESDVAGAQLGFSVAIAGDVENDGFEDILIGVPGWSNGQLGEGRAVLFRGNGTGNLGTTPQWTFESDEAGAEFGRCVARAGDPNGDGLSDVAIGAPGMRAGQADRGAVYVFHGLVQDSLDASPRLVLDPGLVGSRFGAALSFGDSNRDGFDDLAVGAPAWSGGQGLVHVYVSRNASGLDPTVERIYVGSSATSAFGAAIAFSGDLTADGTSDLLVSSTGSTELGNVVGAIQIYLGSVFNGLSLTENQRFYGTQHLAGFGSAIAYAGDLNADGFAEVIIGSPQYDGAFVDGGRVEVHLGVSTGSAASPGWTLDGPSAGAGLGGWVAGNADFDGDGFSDLAYGLPGVSTIVAGSGSSGVTAAYGSEQRRVDDTLAISLLGASEVSNGLNFSCESSNAAGLSSTPAGRQDARLTSMILNSGGTQSSAYFDTGLPSGSPISPRVLVTGLPLSTAFFWQSRLEYRNPYFPHSRWLGPQGNARRAKKFVTAQDCNSNGFSDLRDIALGSSTDTNRDNVPDECQIAVSLFCFGDGSGTACPCGNSSTPGADAGCLSSLSIGGTLRSVGVPRVTADDFVVIGASMPNSSALYFQGTAKSAGGAGTVFGDGLRCAAGSVTRLGTKTNAAGTSRYPVPGDLPISVKGVVPFAGATREYQCWYRNAAAFCSASTFNLTNGLTAVWVP